MEFRRTYLQDFVAFTGMKPIGYAPALMEDESIVPSRHSVEKAWGRPYDFHRPESGSRKWKQLQVDPSPVHLAVWPSGVQSRVVHQLVERCSVDGPDDHAVVGATDAIEPSPIEAATFEPKRATIAESIHVRPRPAELLFEKDGIWSEARLEQVADDQQFQNPMAKTLPIVCRDVDSAQGSRGDRPVE